MKNALVVGINNYHYIGELKSCVNDAHAVARSLAEEVSGRAHFNQVDVIPDYDDLHNCQIEIDTLQPLVQEFLKQENELSLFYFSGHASNGYLKCTDSRGISSPGINMNDLMGWVERSKARNIIIILDCCHAGEIAENMFANEITSLPKGVTILAASDSDQKAAAGGEDSFSVFTDLMLHGLSGAAANSLGEITPATLYAMIDQSLGMTGQRPVFKSNTVGFVDIKKVEPKLDLADLKKSLRLFDHADKSYPLNPSHEPVRNKGEEHFPPPIEKLNKAFSMLQKLCQMGLVQPSAPDEHMYFAAMNSGSCELTPSGKHYFKLVERGVI